MLAYHIARFKVNATPPLGHPLCGGWIQAATAIDDPLWLRGVVLQAEGPPIVLAALDWTGLMNRSHDRWRNALADAAKTTPDRVAIHCVHQHNAPFADHGANAYLREARADTQVFDEEFHEVLLTRTRDAVREALTAAVPVTHVGAGTAEVREVASNRRVMGRDGKVAHIRYSACADAEVRAAPVGTIDPTLASVSFYGPDGQPLARLHHYTTHPMSYYGDGRVSADFVGLARDRRAVAEPDTLSIYFTGCAGNITAGKYNDGSRGNRAILADRLHAGMVAADAKADTARHGFTSLAWRTRELRLRPNEGLDRDALLALVRDESASVVSRHGAAMRLAFLDRCEEGHTITLSRCDLPGARLLHLPGETFVEYQLEAQSVRLETTLATAAYGDDGPWYIPLKRSFDEGGYEPTAAFVATDTEEDYRAAIRGLLAE